MKADVVVADLLAVMKRTAQKRCDGYACRKRGKGCIGPDERKAHAPCAYNRTEHRGDKPRHAKQHRQSHERGKRRNKPDHARNDAQRRHAAGVPLRRRRRGITRFEIRLTAHGRFTIQLAAHGRIVAKGHVADALVLGKALELALLLNHTAIHARPLP